MRFRTQQANPASNSQAFRRFIDPARVAQIRRVSRLVEVRVYLWTFQNVATEANVFGTKRQNAALRSATLEELKRWRSNRPVVFPGQFQELLFHRAKVASVLAGGQFAESFIAKVALVPTLRPTQPVEEPVQFRFTVAGVRSVPARFRSRLLGVVPSRTSFLVQGEFGQAQDHLDVADQLGFVERSGKSPNLDPLSSSGEVRQVQKVVAVGFAACLRRIFVAVGFDLLCPLVSFAASRSGRCVDRFLVVGDQGNQSSQGRRIAVPGNGDVQAARFVDPCAAFLDRFDRGLDVLQTLASAEDR